MAGINDKLVYPVEYFDGGKNSKYGDNIIVDNESPDCLNVETDELGNVRTRYGSLVATHSGATGNLGTGTWYGFTKFEVSTGASFAVGWYNSSMYEASASTFNEFTSGSLTMVTIPSAESVFAATNVANFVYDNKLFMCDGVTVPYKYDGTDFTRMGVDTPSNTLAATTAVTAGAVLGSGVYQYKVAYVNSALTPGDLPTTSLVFTAHASNIVSITGIPTAAQSFGIERRYLYRTTVDGDIFYFLDEIADNSTTTYKDETPDTDLVEQAPIDQGYPPHFRLALQHKDRVFAVDDTDPSILKYSEVGNTSLWPAENLEPLGEGSGKIKTITVHNDAILAVKNDGSAWLLFLADNDPNNFIPIRINTPYGTNSSFSISYGDNAMYLGTIGSRPFNFIGVKGIGPINESITTDEGSTVAKFISQKISNDIELFGSSLLDNINGIVFRDRVYIAVPFMDGAEAPTENNRIYEYDFFTRKGEQGGGAWWPFSNLSVKYFTIFKDKLMSVPDGERDFSSIFQLDVEDRFKDDTYDSDGDFAKDQPINSYFLTKRYHAGNKIEQNHKDFRTAFLWVGKFDIATLIRVNYRIDFDDSDGVYQEIDLDATGTQWNEFNWNEARWNGADTSAELDIDLGTISGRRIQFKFSNGNTIDNAFLVKRLGIEFTLRPRRKYLTS